MKIKNRLSAVLLLIIAAVCLTGCLTIIFDDSFWDYEPVAEDSETSQEAPSSQNTQQRPLKPANTDSAYYKDGSSSGQTAVEQPEQQTQPEQPIEVAVTVPEVQPAPEPEPAVQPDGNAYYDDSFTESESLDSSDAYEAVGVPETEAVENAPARVRKHDPNAVVDRSASGQRMGEYFVGFNMYATMAYFRPSDNPRINKATYDLVKQEWVVRNKDFNDADIDLTKLYSTVSLTHEELNNTSEPEDPTEYTDRRNPGHVQYGVVPSAWLRRVSDLEQQFGFKIDTNAIYRTDLEGKVMWGYKIAQTRGHAGVYFYINDGRPTRNAIPEAYYNTREQYWELKKDSFDSSKIDLTKIYQSINMTHSQLDRLFPQEVVRLDQSRAAAYNSTLTRDLNDFIAYLRRGGATETQIEFFQDAAKVAGKRGNVLPFEYGKLYDVNDVGMQMGVFTPIEAQSLTDADYIREHFEQAAVGGMQYYFEAHKDDWVLGRNIDAIKNSTSIPIRLIEVVPTDREVTSGMLSGEALRARVESELEHAFGMDVTVSLSTERVDYSVLEEAGGEGVGKMGRTIAKLHELYNGRYSDEVIFIDYFMNKPWLKSMDEDMSHPVGTGTYGTDWERVHNTILHELGHALGLRHHFTKERAEIYSDIDEHISPACIMNYRYKSDTFCPLCRYALGIEDAY